MKKKICTLFLLCICLLCFCGCTKTSDADANLIFEKNAFRIVRKTNNQGEISLSYIFPVNKHKLQALGFSEAEVSVYQFYLTTYVNALAKTNRENNVEGVEVGSCQHYTDIDGIGFSILFEDLRAQKRFFKVEDETENTVQTNRKTSGIFVNKLEIFTIFPVFSKKSAENLKSICTMAAESWCENDNIAKTQKENICQIFENSVFIYDFASQQGFLKSEIMYDDDSFHHNIFIKTAEDIENDNKIVFYVTSINKPLWYILAVIIVVAGMVCSWLCFRKREKLQKK